MNIVPFSFESQEVRIIIDSSDVPWFVAKDVSDVLGYDQTSNALKLCRHSSNLDEMNKINGLHPATKWIPESDVYRLVMRSTLPSAERFQDWVVEEVLPSIRKTGSYVGPKPNSNWLEMRDGVECLVNVAKLYGFEGNQAVLSANRAARNLFKIDFLELMGQKALVADTQDQLLVVTEIATRLGWPVRLVNPRLTESGLQDEYRDHANKLCYELTDMGRAFGLYVDTGKHHGNGTPIRQLKWRAPIVDFLKNQYQVLAA